MAAQAEMGHLLPERRAGMPFGPSTSVSLGHPPTEEAVRLTHCVLWALPLLDMQSPGHCAQLQAPSASTLPLLSPTPSLTP